MEGVAETAADAGRPEGTAVGTQPQALRLSPQASPAPTTAVVLAAGRGSRMRSAHPKVLSRVGGITLIERVVRTLYAAGIERVVVVVGYRSEEVIQALRATRLRVEVIHNVAWQRGDLGSVMAGIRSVEGRCLVAMGDHVFGSKLVERVLETPGELVVAVDRDLSRCWNLEDATKVRVDESGRLTALGKELSEFDGVDIGLAVLEAAETLAPRSPGSTLWNQLKHDLIASGREVVACDAAGALWADVDTPAEVRRAERELCRELGPKPGDGHIARHLNRRISLPVSRALLRTSMTPGSAGAAAFLTVAAGAAAIASGQTWGLVLGGVLIQLGSALDGVDGELARVALRTSPRGEVLDTVLDRVGDLAAVVALVLAAGATDLAWAFGLAAAIACLQIPFLGILATRFGQSIRTYVRRDLRLLLFASVALVGQPLGALAAVAVLGSLDAIRAFAVLLRRLPGPTSGVPARRL